MKTQMRILLGLLILSGSLLLLGSGGAFGSSQEKRQIAERNREAALQVVRAVPENLRDGWTRCAQVSPELCVRAGHSGLKPLPSK